MSTNEMQSMSDKALRRLERDASRRLADIAAGGDPGRGLPSDAAQAARDSLIIAARAARAEADTARAALSQREANKQTFFGRMFASEAANKRQARTLRPPPRPNGRRFTPSFEGRPGREEQGGNRTQEGGRLALRADRRGWR